MSEQQPKKPKDIKDLKARLGRTIAPNTQKGAPITAPAIGAAVAPPAGGVAPPPGGGFGAPVVPPPSAPGTIPAPVMPGAGVAPPPFMKSGQSVPPPRRAADPFAAASGGVSAATRAQEVRLVIDEKPVDDREVGRAARGRVFIVLALGIAVGATVGLGGGTVYYQRTQTALAIQDGKDIYATVHTASDVVNNANRHIHNAITKASANPPAVDFAEIEALRGLKKPLDAGAFARKRYGAFNPGTVDSLFEYYNDVNLLWEKFAALEAKTLNQGARTELSNAAANAAALSTTQYGMLPHMQDSVFTGILVYVDTPPPPPPGPPVPRTKATIRERRGGAAAEKAIYMATEDQNIEEHPADYVILVDTASSIQVLGQTASAFGEYRRQLNEIKDLLDKTTQTQGLLETQLGEIAAMAQ